MPVTQQCNYCKLQTLIHDNPDSQIELKVKQSARGFRGSAWITAFIDGQERQSYLTLTTKCTCHIPIVPTSPFIEPPHKQRNPI